MSQSKQNNMELLVGTNLEVMSRTIYIAVDVQFDKNGETYEANLTCCLSEDINIGFDSWDITIANEEELPELTAEETEQLKEFAKKYAQVLAD